MLSGRSLASATTTTSTMAPSLRPSSPPPLATSSARRHKPAPAFHLDNLPRFHPAVYRSPNSTPHTQSSTTSTSTSSQQPPPSSSFCLQTDPLRQYRDFVSRSTTTTTNASITSAPNSAASYAKPAKPRLDPLGSPGPVTPLALEDQEGGYLATGLAHNNGSGHAQSQSQTQSHADRMRSLPGGGATGDLVMHLIQSENERFAGKSFGTEGRR